MVIFISLVLTFNVFAIELTNKLAVENLGEIDTLAISPKQTVSVYLPDNYQSSKQRYPVMYVIDGERYFLNAITYQKNLVWQDKVAAFIVVGINTNYIARRQLLGRKSGEFIQQLATKIIPYIDQHYRTSSKRMYFGWEMAGGFALELLTQQPELFDHYFLASSTHFTEKRLEQLKQSLKQRRLRDKFIYFTLGEVESWSLAPHQKLSEILAGDTKNNLVWRYKLLSEDDHYSTPLVTLNQGLGDYYQSFSPIRFYTIAEFKEFGGMKALKQHYQERASQYQVSAEIHDDTKHYLLNQAINENDFDFFVAMTKAFNGFIEQKGYSPGFLIKIGSFYFANGQVDKAINLYRLGLKAHVNSHRLNAALASVYQQQENIKQAKKYYQAALKLVPPNSKAFKDYQLKLAMLK